MTRDDARRTRVCQPTRTRRVLRLGVCTMSPGSLARRGASVSGLGGGGRPGVRVRLGRDRPADSLGVRLLLGGHHAVDVHGQQHAVDHEYAPVTRVNASADNARLRPTAGPPTSFAARPVVVPSSSAAFSARSTIRRTAPPAPFAAACVAVGLGAGVTITSGDTWYADSVAAVAFPATTTASAARTAERLPGRGGDRRGGGRADRTGSLSVSTPIHSFPPTTPCSASTSTSFGANSVSTWNAPVFSSTSGARPGPRDPRRTAGPSRERRRGVGAFGEADVPSPSRRHHQRRSPPTRVDELSSGFAHTRSHSVEQFFWSSWFEVVA